VADAFLSDRREAESCVELPSSGVVFWRVRLRMEREAKDAAAKTVEKAHSAVLAVTAAVVAAILVATSLLRIGWHWITSAMPQAADVIRLTPAMPLTVVVLAVIAILIFAPFAIYLAMVDE
jgi:hypothetical protein